VDDQLLSPKEAAEYMRVSPSLVYRLCDERRIPHYRIGGRGKRGKLLISPRDLDAFMESQRVGRHPLLDA
jgi:excisionase family DNA binding protein